MFILRIMKIHEDINEDFDEEKLSKEKREDRFCFGKYLFYF